MHKVGGRSRPENDVSRMLITEGAMKNVIQSRMQGPGHEVQLDLN